MSIEDPQKTDSCGCCEAPLPPTPELISNRPGLRSIRYRAGTYASFCQAMFQAIASSTVQVNGTVFRPLRQWTTRSKDDYGIALLEMWAYLADILTFYQERIANEAFLRTALLRESVLRLAALLDYKPAPGVAATAHLAFTLEAGKQVQIPLGLRVQSVPGQNEKPQKFETVEAVSADARLNRVRVFPKPQPFNPLAKGSSDGILRPDEAALIAAELSPGDKLVIYPEKSAANNPGTGKTWAWRGLPNEVGAEAFAQPQAFQEELLVQKPAKMALSPEVAAELVEEKQVEGLQAVDWFTVLSWSPPVQTNSWTLSGARMFKWLRKFRLFGYNAPQSYLKAKPKSPGHTEISWTEVRAGDDGYKFDIAPDNALNLDALYDDLKVGTQVLISTPKFAQLTSVAAVGQVAASQGPLSATVTRITLVDSLPAIADLCNVTIYELAGPEIIFWGRDYEQYLSPGTDTIYVTSSDLPCLEPKRTVILDDEQGNPQSITVSQAIPEEDHLAITFTPALTRELDAATAVLYGNVAKATHGETIADEVLGNGDASSQFQSFSIKKSPVTFVSRPGASHGAANTLRVRVGKVLWQEANTLYGHDGEERVYTTAVDEGGIMTVKFGDGKTGAHLPTGRDNVVATYRQGLGQSGNVKANSLTTLLDRPVGLKGVANPAPAQGGADRESLAKARDDAPNTVRTFGRIVSLRDFEDAAREFAGIAKARAVWKWDGQEQLVHLTAAGDAGAEVKGQLKKNLKAYLDVRRDPNRKLRIQSYRKVFVQVEALVEHNPAYLPEDIQKSASDALLEHFAFDRRDLGQPVQLSDLYRVLHDVQGVVAVDINKLQFKLDADRKTHGATDHPVQARLRLEPNELACVEIPATDAVVTIGVVQS